MPNNQGSRNSSIELLRLILMLFILTHHALGICWNFPSKSDFLSFPSLEIAKLSINHLCIIAVNVFVLISGYFGIRPSLKGFLYLCFKCFFFQVIALLFSLMIGTWELSWTNILSLIVPGSGYWFIVCYLSLYCLAPILNVFAESSSQSTFKNTLLSFFVIQTVYGLICWKGGFGSGYSTLSFIGLYLTARYIHRFSLFDLKSRRFFLWMYLVLAMFSVLVSLFFGVICDGTFLASYKTESIGYITPFIILSSICFLGLFVKTEFRSSVINQLSKSSLAIYLFHCHPLILPYYISYFPSIHCFDINYIVQGIAVILSFFWIAILFDRLRMFIWNFIVGKVDMLR